MWGLSWTDVAQIAGYVGALVLMEGLFSADNALVLAVMVRHLPRPQQRRVLYWGIWGAIGFRIFALCLSSVLLNLWYCKVVGGLYLLYLTGSHFLLHRNEPAGIAESPPESRAAAARRLAEGFWGTVVSITLADIAFSIDSILAAVSIAEGFPDRFGAWGKLSIVIVGGILGIITMRFVVKYFLLLLDRFPGLDDGAYYLVAWIGLKLLISGLHSGKYLPFHIPEPVFWLGMLLIAGLSLFLKPVNRPPTDEDMHLLDPSPGPSSDDDGDDSRGDRGGNLDLLDPSPGPSRDDGGNRPRGEVDPAKGAGARLRGKL
jgi:YkoY family integral membrane protein